MKRNKVNKIILVIDIILLIISIISYRYIFQVETTKRIYSDEAEKFVSENQKPVFKINQIIIYSSANAIDNSDGELKNLDISQFSDIEIFIDNKNNSKEITAENTINELFIDNIKVESNSEKGEKIFDIVNMSMPDMLNPKLTASWEKGLDMVAKKEIKSDEFMTKLETYIHSKIDKLVVKM